MIRPEVKTLLYRWREVFFAIGAAGIGIYWGLTTFGILAWLGWAVAGFGGAMAIVGWQKIRFASSELGPGVVTLDERRIIYMGPKEGGVADLDLVVQLELTVASIWRLVNRDGNVLEIPANAQGADALFDVFAALPGAKTSDILKIMAMPRRATMTVWLAPDYNPHAQLH